MMAAPPFVLASHSGVAPARFAARGFAPARSSVTASSSSPRYTAQCSAVAPSACGAFTSAFDAISARTAATSPRIAASARSLVAAAPAASATTSAAVAATRTSA
jgi:hypothetical protein